MSAWGAAFGSAWGISWGSIQEERITGGWYERVRTVQEIEQERIRIGIIPAKVKKSIEKAVGRAVEAATRNDYQNLEDWLRKQKENALRAFLIAELDRYKQQQDERYFDLFRLRILEIARQREEEIILMLLFEM